MLCGWKGNWNSATFIPEKKKRRQKNVLRLYQKIHLIQKRIDEKLLSPICACEDEFDKCESLAFLTSSCEWTLLSNSVSLTNSPFGLPDRVHLLLRYAITHNTKSIVQNPNKNLQEKERLEERILLFSDINVFRKEFRLCNTIIYYIGFVNSKCMIF